MNEKACNMEIKFCNLSIEICNISIRKCNIKAFEAISLEKLQREEIKIEIKR